MKFCNNFEVILSLLLERHDPSLSSPLSSPTVITPPSIPHCHHPSLHPSLSSPLPSPTVITPPIPHCHHPSHPPLSSPPPPSLTATVITPPSIPHCHHPTPYPSQLLSSPLPPPPPSLTAAVITHPPPSLTATVITPPSIPHDHQPSLHPSLLLLHAGSLPPLTLLIQQSTQSAQSTHKQQTMSAHAHSEPCLHPQPQYRLERVRCSQGICMAERNSVTTLAVYTKQHSA